jgi:hypothetical protein
VACEPSLDDDSFGHDRGFAPCLFPLTKCKDPHPPALGAGGEVSV